MMTFPAWKPGVRVAVFQDGALRQVDDLTLREEEKAWQVRSEKYRFQFTVTWQSQDERLDVFLPLASVVEEGTAKIAAVTFLPDLFAAACGEEGYLVLPVQLGVRCGFTEREAKRIQIPIYTGSCREGTMACFGIVRRQGCLSGILTAGACDASLEVDICNGKEKAYAVAPVFHLRDGEDDSLAGEGFGVRYLYDDGPGRSYVQVANRYRTYQLAEGGLRPLKERMTDRPALQYAAKAMNIRIRQAWKPAPGALDQTVENEPPVRAAMPFAKVKQFLDALREEGLDRAEICLVGWNAKGHDGRYPQILPVEESLGGEAALRDLIAYGKSLGYQMTCHDNYFDAYRISEDWDEEDIIRDREGKLMQGGVWSGGQSYWVCGRVAVQKYLRRNVAAEKDLGFAGVHYSDVLSILGPNKCYHPGHPTSRSESAACRREMLAYFQQELGGSSSESLLDFAAPALDRALYVEFGREKLLERDYVDEIIPLLPIVYHGIVLYNISTESVNCIIKDREIQLRCAEYGSIAQSYLYSGFMTEQKDNWMGQVDLTAEDGQDMRRTAQLLKRQVELLADITALQDELIANHERLAEQVYQTTYQNGSCVIVNYGAEPFREQQVPARGFVVAHPSKER